MNFFIMNISRIQLNGYAVKTFEVWKRLPDGTQAFATQTHAPVAIANRDLLSHYINKSE